MLMLALLALLLTPQPATASTAGADEVEGLPPHTLEELFRKTLSADSARTNLKFLTSVPHQAGSVGDFEMAKVRKE